MAYDAGSMHLQMSYACFCRCQMQVSADVICMIFFDIFEENLIFLDFYDFLLLFKTLRISIENQVFFCYFRRKLDFSWVLIFLLVFKTLRISIEHLPFFFDIFEENLMFLDF